MNGSLRFILDAELFAVRVELVEAIVSSRVLGLPASRGLPGGNSLSFCVAKKKVSKEKGDPAVCVPPLRYGQPAVLGPDGAGLELATLRQSPVLVRLALRSSAHTEGWWRRERIRDRAPARTRFARPRLPASAFFSPPVGLGRGAQRKMDQGERLSERSEFELDPIFREHRRLPRSAAQGSQTIGSPFFWVLFFGDAKKSASPAGARPGLPRRPQT